MRKSIAPLSLLLVAFCASAGAQVTSFCPGDGCPCENDDLSAGCANLGADRDSSTGATLSVLSGTTDVVADDLVLIGEGMGATHVALLISSKAAMSTIALGNGLRCVGTGGALFRFPVRQTSLDGAFVEQGLVATSQTLNPQAAITAGTTWHFQAWYRDTSGLCGEASNLSNALAIQFSPSAPDGPVETELAGNPLASYPFFEFVRAVNQGTDLHIGIDPTRHPVSAGTTVDVWVVAARSRLAWEGDPTLVDVRRGAQEVTIVGNTIEENTVMLDAGTLNGTSSALLGVGYDVVVDVDRDGLLGTGDLIDGFDDVAGIHITTDTAAPGPYAISSVIYTGGTFLGQKTYYPTDIATLGAVPLVVVSHGNGHNYLWYDHLGEHLASWGYVLMSHENNTGPGPEAASQTTLDNTEFFLANLDTIDGGVLDGHIDSHRIVWIGHSRGGEGVVRAYDRLFDGEVPPAHFTIDDIVLVSSIAPTNFLGRDGADPHDVNYHLWVGSADSDVTGAPNNNAIQSYQLYERATANRVAITLQGVGHGVFHDGGGNWFADGPCTIGRGKTHKLMRGYVLPLVRHFVEQEPVAKDFLWRQWEGFMPIGAPLPPQPCISVNLEFIDGPAAGNVILDDFQSEPGENTSSSGGAVTFTVTDLVEGRLDDDNGNFTWFATDPMNGMTRSSADDDSAGVVFSWDGPAFYEQEVVLAERDLRDDAFLSFRACQGTRHPNTMAALEDLTFDVTLVDGQGGSSSISVDASGGGVEEPYQRTGTGLDAGWANEFETIRLRLTDFLTDGSGLDLANVVAVRFELGYPGRSPVGRLGLDQIELTKD